MELKVFQLTLEQCKNPLFQTDEFAIFKLANLNSSQVKALYAFVRGPGNEVTASDGYGFALSPSSELSPVARPIAVLNSKDNDGREQFCIELKVRKLLAVVKKGEPFRDSSNGCAWKTPVESGFVTVPNSLISAVFAAVNWP